MSFNNYLNSDYTPLENVVASDEEGEYRGLVTQISGKIHQINSIVSRFKNNVDKLGSKRDTRQLRNNIQRDSDRAADMFREINEGLRDLAKYQKNDAQKSRARNLEQQKLARDLAKTISEFQKAQKMEKIRAQQVVESSKVAVEEAKQRQQQNQRGSSYIEDQVRGEEEQLQQQQQQQQQRQAFVGTTNAVSTVMENSINFNEILIQEREQEIVDIERGIVELNEIFRDLGTIVVEQQSLLDNIETNVSNTNVNAERAVSELRIASENQRKALKNKCLLMTMLIIIFVVLLLVALS